MILFHYTLDIWILIIYYRVKPQGREVKLMIRIKDLRVSRDLSQKELANKLGVAQTQVSRWEKDQLSMSSQSLIKVSQYFNVSTDDLLGVKHKECV